jgi:hypothetical protein
MPKGIRRARVAWEIRPKPRKPIVRRGEVGVVLSCGPQKANGDQLKEGHCKWKDIG